MELATPIAAGKSAFFKYAPYVAGLEQLNFDDLPPSKWNAACAAALNGQSTVMLRRHVSLKTRRRFGAYFTGTKLSGRLLSRLCANSSGSIFYDPSCGMGDLLLAAAKLLPLGRSLEETVRSWGQKLAGTDLHEEFIRGAKVRIVLLARQRLRTREPLKIPSEEVFPNIKIGNGLAEEVLLRRANVLLMNPPFGIVKAQEDCDWASGNFSESATFMMKAVKTATPGTEILAILPDVLRSGSFSEKWRERIGLFAEVHRVEPYGVFDESADVDVFLLRLVKRTDTKLTRKRWPARRKLGASCIADHFEVKVGTVVPHRDPETGSRYDYIHPRCIPPWLTIRELSEKRRHEGAVVQPPFVAIRRTSRPGDRFRATATVIASRDKVAVENHLIICKPKDGLLRSCKNLVRVLKTKKVNSFLDKRIRCRHLTVSAVKEIPIKGTNE